jgi:hypothetical protein
MRIEPLNRKRRARASPFEAGLKPVAKRTAGGIWIVGAVSRFNAKAQRRKDAKEKTA